MRFRFKWHDRLQAEERCIDEAQIKRTILNPDDEYDEGQGAMRATGQTSPGVKHKDWYRLERDSVGTETCTVITTRRERQPTFTQLVKRKRRGRK